MCARLSENLPLQGETKQDDENGFSYRNLPLLFLQAREAVFAGFRPTLNQAGVTEPQWRVLRVLLEYDALEPRQIGEICYLSSPSLAGILSRMDDLGLVSRKRLEHDQRRVHVSVTEKGRALAASLAPQIDQVYRQLEELLGSEFVEALYGVLNEVIVKAGADMPLKQDAAVSY